MRKFFTLLMVLSLSWSLAGCSPAPTVVDDNAPEEDMGDMDAQVDGGEIMVEGAGEGMESGGEGDGGDEGAPPA